MGRFHPFRTIFSLAAGLYAGLYIDQNFRVPSASNPLEFVKLITAISQGADSDIISKSVKWIEETGKKK